MELSQTPLSSADWQLRANSNLKERFVIDLDDAGLSERDLRVHALHFPNPAEFVEWFAVKYDLTPASDWNWA